MLFVGVEFGPVNGFHVLAERRRVRVTLRTAGSFTDVGFLLMGGDNGVDYGLKEKLETHNNNENNDNNKKQQQQS